MRPGTLPLLGALVPITVVAACVLATRLRLAQAGWLGAALAALVASVLYRMDLPDLGVAVGKGMWLGLWVLAIIVPALMLFAICESAGAIDVLARELGALAHPGITVVMLAVAFPVALQGVAGFGIPIALAAPLLVRVGLAPIAAVSAVSIGYNWGVAFGSLGSPYYVLVATSGLPQEDARELAIRTAAILAANCLVATLLVLRHVPRESRRSAVPVTLAVAVVMAVVALACAALQPALLSFASGLAGIAVCLTISWRRGGRIDARRSLVGGAPFLILGALILVASLPAIRRLGDTWQVAPHFPATRSGYGHHNPAVAHYSPLALAHHPITFVVPAMVIAALLYWRLGRVSGAGIGAALRAGARRATPSTIAVPALTVLGTVMVDSGMTTSLASALSGALGSSYVALVPVVAAAGTLVIGNNTAGNALFGPFQAAAATHLGCAPSVLLAAQGAGAAIGNTLAPVNLLVGLSAVHASGEEGRLLRINAPDAALLVAVTCLATLVQLWLT